MDGCIWFVIYFLVCLSDCQAVRPCEGVQWRSSCDVGAYIVNLEVSIPCLLFEVEVIWLAVDDYMVVEGV